ncbi:uncharacterized protein [Periplaneta americana]|uniref:uncharacterized protein isoform X1 n=1 Tax=Periplaneta americana TaxID=6978 RepID=UPI0037E88E13
MLHHTETITETQGITAYLDGKTESYSRPQAASEDPGGTGSSAASSHRGGEGPQGEVGLAVPAWPGGKEGREKVGSSNNIEELKEKLKLRERELRETQAELEKLKEESEREKVELRQKYEGERKLRLQQEEDNKLYPPGYLRFKTLREMWTVQPKTTMKWGRSDGYGMVWVVVPAVQEHGGGDTQRFAVGHTGGAVGASSVLLMVPVTPSESSSKTLTEGPLSDSAAEICIPSGVTVAVIVNIQDVGLQHLALDVAAIFCEALKPS